MTWLLVAILFTAAITAARRGGADIPRRVALLFGALVLLFLFAPLTGPYVIIPADVVRLLPPWSETVPPTTKFTKYEAVNFEIQDVAMQIAPWAHQARAAWRSLDFPIWNSLAGSGYPLLGNAQSQALAPLRLLTLPLPLGQAMTAEAAMKILTALTCTWLYCRRRYGPLPSLIGAIAFAFGTFIQSWLQFPIASVAAFLPATFLSIDLLVERAGMGRFLFAAVCGAAIAFGGHPETAAHMLFYASLYALWILMVTRPHRETKERLRAAGRLGLAFGTAFLLALPFIAPFLEALPRSARYEDARTRTRAAIPYSDLRCAMLLLQPHFYGVVPREVPWGPSVAEAISGFAGIVGIAAWLACAIRSVLRRKWRAVEVFFVVAALLALAVIVDWAPVSVPFKLLFPYALNARVRLLLCWALAVLTAAALDDAQRHGPVPILIGLLGASSILLLALTTTAFPSLWARDTAILAAMPSVVAIAAASVFATIRRHNVALVGVALAILMELWSFGRPWHPILPERSLYPGTPLTRAIERLRLREEEPFRFVGFGPAFFPNAHALFGVEDVRVHDPMASARYIGFLRATTGFETREYFSKWTNTETTVLDYLNVKYAITPPGTDLPGPRYTPVYDGEDGRIFQNADVLPRFFPVRNVILDFNDDSFLARRKTHTDWRETALLRRLTVSGNAEREDLFKPRPADAKAASMKIESSGQTSFVMTVNAPRYTLIASSIPWWPGWRVRSDGARIRPVEVNGAFLGFVVPPGTRRVHVDYAPVSFYGGLLISLTTVAALAAYCLRRRSFMIRARV